MRQSRRQIASRSPVAAAVAAAIAAAQCAAALAGDLDSRQSFAIPPQSLSSALLAFSEQASIQVMMASDAMTDMQTRGVSGKRRSEEALETLLQGTGMRFFAVSADAVAIEAQGGLRPTAALSGSRLRLAWAGDATATEDQAASTKQESPLEEVVVRGITLDYTTVESANKMPLAVKDTPFSVKTVTEDMLDFASITKLQDVYKIDAGSIATNQQDQWVENYFRGFQNYSGISVKIDGFVSSGSIQYDLAPFERFEIIKGTPSTMYGQVLIGGMINAVSKKPQDRFASTLSAEAGSHDHYRVELDVTGPMTADGKLTGRLVGSWLDEDSFLDYAFNRRRVIAPSVKYAFTDDTSLSLMAQYVETDFLSSHGFGAQYLGGDPYDAGSYTVPDVPRSRLIAAIGGNRKSSMNYLYTRALVEHELAGDWRLRGMINYSEQDVHGRRSYGGAVDPDGFSGVDLYSRDVDGAAAYGGEVNLYGDIEAFGRAHTLFFGVDYQNDKSNDHLDYAGAYGTGPLNVFDPDYSLLPDPASVEQYGADGQDAYHLVARQRNVTYGASFQAILKPLDRLQLMLGTRYSVIDIDDERLSSWPGDSSLFEFGSNWPFRSGTPAGADPSWSFSPNHTDNKVWTHQVGATYAITPDTNVYASYAEGFFPRNARAYDADNPDTGKPVGAEESESYEIGLKGELFNRELSWSLAGFDIARTNITETDYAHPQFVVLAGKQRSRGIEFDFQGKITDSWDIYASTAYIANKYMGGQYDGRYSFAAPKLGISLFSNYQVRQGRLAGFGMGAGVVYKKMRDFIEYTTDADGNPLSLNLGGLFDDPLEVDVRFYYQADEHWRYRLSVTNLFADKYYVPVSTAFWGLSANPGRQLIAGVNYRF